MRASRHLRFLAAAALVAVAAAQPIAALAADKDADRMRASLRRAQEGQRKAEQEKAAVAAERDTLQQEKEKLEAEVKSLGARVQTAQAALARSKKELETAGAALDAAKKNESDLSKALADAREQIAAAKTAHEATGKTLAARDGELKQLTSAHERSTQRVKLLEERNAKLYQLGLDLIGRFENRGLWETVRGSEPFTRLKRVELENLMEDYRDKLRSERASPATR
jgi:chromosome segregation ATPase